MDKVAVSKQISYWLRHDPEDMDMDENGYVEMEGLLDKLKDRFPEIDRETLEEINSEGKKRYEINGDKIRARYGHTIDMNLGMEPHEEVKELYHGTTPESMYKILRQGLEPKDRNKVHLSATKKVAREVGKRRTENPEILKIDAESARKDGIEFYRANEQVFLCEGVPPQYIEKVN